MEFKVGDKVKTKFGIGKIIETQVGISKDSFLVYHDNWKNGHNGNDFCEGNYKGKHCWYFEDERDMELIDSKTTILETCITANSITFQTISSLERIPERYIINKGATILFWKDGSKTIVKKSKDDKYDKRLGFLTAYFQKHSGMSKNKANKYLDELAEEGN